MTKFSALETYESTHGTVIDVRILPNVVRRMKLVDALLDALREGNADRARAILTVLDASYISYVNWSSIFGSGEDYFG